MSARSQRYMVWWGIVWAVVYGLSLALLLQMVPPPSATLSTQEIATWYADRHDSVRIGAMISGWSAGWLLPIAVVVACQLWRLGRDYKAWALLALVGGSFTSLFVVLPPLLWGAAAFTVDRSPDATAALHEVAVLSFTTTDQYFPFLWVAVAVACFRAPAAPFSPFSRWMGWLSIWSAVAVEPGAVSFLPRTGPLAWDGLLVFWQPVFVIGIWFTAFISQILKALRLQEAAELDDAADPSSTVPST